MNMATVTFDTLEAVRRLKEAGYEEKQAEAIVRVIGQAQDRLVTTDHFDSRFTLLQWMIGINLTVTLGALWKLMR